MLYSLRKFSDNEVATERAKILSFYDSYGEEATKKAFGVDRKLIYVWKKRLTQGRGQLMSLLPSSTKPRRARQMQVHPKIIEFIRGFRENHPRIGKEKLKPLLDQYCNQSKIKSISESSIGKIIKRYKFYAPRIGKIYHNPNSKWNLKRRKVKRLRVKRAPHYEEPGHFQADTSFYFSEGIKRYFISAIDGYLKFSFTNCYSSLSSLKSRDFIEKLMAVYPLKLKSIQTDNGSEFLGKFDAYLQNQKIPHYFSYPRCPKINGCVERFNRTLKEEFLYNNLDLLENIPALQQKLAQYLIFYNTQRPHKTLDLKSPLQYLISQGALSNMSATYTTACIITESFIKCLIQ
ncbi:MAG TPA: integrase core domain-containing protein [Bdellovibrionota bacterium]|nr:integrase core domain-containing protein [Bdellovibrionota bacterium]